MFKQEKENKIALVLTLVNICDYDTNGSGDTGFTGKKDNKAKGE